MQHFMFWYSRGACSQIDEVLATDGMYHCGTIYSAPFYLRWYGPEVWGSSSIMSNLESGFFSSYKMLI
jgi:hypothetical protein